MEKKNKKLNKMTLEELYKKKSELEKNSHFERVTKAKTNPKTIKWSSNQTQSTYYKHLMNEINSREIKEAS